MTANIVGDVINDLFEQGRTIGLTGIRTACPIEIWDNPEHIFRDAWVNGYQDGLREYRRDYKGKKHWRLSITDLPRPAHKLFVTHKDGYTIIREHAYGMILVRLRMCDTAILVEPQEQYNPMQAYLLARAIYKAASIAYKVQEDRKHRISGDNPSEIIRNQNERYAPEATSKPQSPAGGESRVK